jgi:H+/Cl- antiporter ClcA
MNQNTGKYIIFIGGILIVAGIIIYFFADKLHWLGRLPGDIRYENANTRIYFPIVTMILLSLLLNLIIYLIKKFL